MDAKGWDERYAGRELLWSGEPNRFVAEELAGATPGTALDLGAGEGRNAVWLAQQGWAVTAVDFSHVAIDKARELADDLGVEIDAIVADVTAIEIEDGDFDLVLLAYLHLPRAALAEVHAEAARALAPGGMLLIVGHDRANLTRGVGGPQDPDVLLAVDEVRADLAGCDVVVERAEQVTREVDTEDGPGTAIDALVRARRPA